MTKVTNRKNIQYRTCTLSNDNNPRIAGTRTENICNEIRTVKDLIAILRDDINSSENRKIEINSEYFRVMTD
jgi:hypothetical protein